MSGTIATDGTPTSLTISTPGDTASVTFTETAGNYVFIDFSGPFYYFSKVRLYDPDGIQVGGNADFGGGFIDRTQLTHLGTGTYTVTLTPSATPTTGTVTFHVWEVPADFTTSATVGGAAASVTISTPGQRASVTFAGTEGESVFTRFGSGPFYFYSKVRLYDHNDQQIGGDANFGDGYMDTIRLPATDTYRLTLFPNEAATRTGSTTFQLNDVPADDSGVISVGGPSVTMTITTQGQRAYRTFYGYAGEPVSASWSGAFSNAHVQLNRPGGQNISSTLFQYGSFGTTTLPVDGVYTLRLDPNEGSVTTGSASFTLGQPGAFEPTQQTFGALGGRGIHALSASVYTADPVNSLTGAFTTSASDLSEASTGVSFAFTRSYTSADATVGRLGPGWTDNYQASLAVQTNGDVLVHGDDGQQVYYAKQPDGSFIGANGALSTLTTVAGGYKLLTHDQVAYTFNASGVLQGELDRNGQGLSFVYDVSGRLWTITDVAGHVVTLTYNASNLVSSVATPDGRTVSYGYTSGRLTSVTLPDPDGGGPLAAPVWTYTYEATGRLWQEIDPNNHTQATNVYDPSTGRVTQQTDANNKTTTFAWDAPTQTATITDADSHIWKDVYQYNVLLKQIDPAGDTTLFGHDTGLDTTGVTAPNGSDTTAMVYQNSNLMTATAPASLGSVQKTFTYDAQNNLKNVTDARSKLTQYGYDTAGNNNSITLDGLQTFGATYNAQGQMLTSTDGNGKQSTYTYDAAGNVASVTAPDPDGAGPLAVSKTTYTYDARGDVLTRVDPLGNCSGCTPANYTTTKTYDANGHLLTETDPLGHTTSHTYDSAGNELTSTDANGHTTTNSYDNANHLIQATAPDPDGAGPLEAPITKYTYDDVGNKLTMVGPRGNCTGCTPATYTTTYAYDQNNRLASETTPKGEKTTYTYDADGNLASTVEPRGNVIGCNCAAQYTTVYTYDAAGRLLTTTDPLGHVTTNHYDAVGNRDWTKAANLHQTSYTYDAAGQVLTVTAPDGGLTTYTYNGNGAVLTRKDDNNHITTYSYDDAARLTQTAGPDPDGAGPLAAPVTSYGYDLNGNRTTLTDPNGNATPTGGDGTTTSVFDRANRLTGISFSDSTPPVGYGYDNIGNRTSMTDGSGSVSYGYDNLSRPNSVTRGSDVFSYIYDVASNMTRRTYPDGTQTTYAYDEDNRLASATSGGNATSYGYDPASHLTTAMLPAGNGYVETRSYDTAGRLTEVKNQKGASTLSDYVSTLDPVGNPTQTVQSAAPAATQAFSYDNNDRLLSVCFQAGTCPNAGDPFIRWTYDKVGNRLTETRPVTTTGYTYNAGDELTQTSAQNTGVSLYPAQAQTDGAQPYWRLGETTGTTFASAVGTYNGTWTGSPTLGAVGALIGDTNKSVTLNGTSQYGTVANNAQMNKTNNFSLELWVKRTKNAATQAIAGKPLTTTTKSENYALWFDTANKIRFEVGNGTNTSKTVTSAAPLDTNWHHVVGTFASGALKLYLDGATPATATATFTTAGTNTSTFNVGLSGATGFGGGLDEIAIYGTALSATQIADHYNKGINTAVTTGYTYDIDGNETAAGATTLSYDLANRLKTLAASGTTTSYSYDGDGNRLQASTGALLSQKTNFLWDTSNSLPQLALERDGSNTLLRRYIYGARRIAMYEGGATYYYQYDSLGSVTNLTSSAGTTEWTDSYEPYGAIHSEVKNDPSAPATLLKFAGEYSDPTGLVYLRARQYDSSTGRFLNGDPVEPATGDPQVARYVYVADSPTVFVDPSGQTLLHAADVSHTSAAFATTPAQALTSRLGLQKGDAGAPRALQVSVLFRRRQFNASGTTARVTANFKQAFDRTVALWNFLAEMTIYQGQTKLSKKSSGLSGCPLVFAGNTSTAQICNITPSGALFADLPYALNYWRVDPSNFQGHVDIYAQFNIGKIIPGADAIVNGHYSGWVSPT